MQIFGEEYRLFASINGDEILNHQFNNPKTYENMKLTTDILGHAHEKLKDITISGNFTFFVRRTTLRGPIIIKIFNDYRILETVCFKIKSCEYETVGGTSCYAAHGNTIRVFKNRKKIDDIENGFYLYEKCFKAEQDDEFAFHAGGDNGVS